MIASANYTINEYLDLEFDKYHPVKKDRPGVQGLLDVRFVVLQYLAISSIGLIISMFIDKHFFIYNTILLVMGIIYNVKPIRSKDIVFIDVLSESVNNPLRFLLGWSLVSVTHFPPSSILISYWFAGAFLMGVKRYAEYRSIGDKVIAASYRKSFGKYSTKNLLVGLFFYALNSVFFLGIFLIKYKVEFLLGFPFISGLFAYYFYLGQSKNSLVHHPNSGKIISS